MPLGLVLGAPALAVLLALYGLGDSRWQLVAVAAGATLACVVACFWIARLLPRYVTLQVLIVSYAIQLAALATIAAIGLPLSPPAHPFDVNPAATPFRAVLAMLLVPVGGLLAAVLWRFASVLRRSPPAAEDQSDIAAERRVYLVFGALLQLLYWPAGLDNAGATGYAVRILASGLTVVPFLAGRDSRDDKGLRRIWLATIAINALIGIVVGARTHAFFPVVLFAAGYISVLPPRQRRFAASLALAASIPLVELSGAAGMVRDDFGRGGLELLRAERVNEVAQAMVQSLKGGDQQDADKMRMHGFGRLLAWTNVVVPLMSPEEIPYRGFDGFVTEAAQTFQIASVSGLTVEDLLDAGLNNEPARLYGFTVNVYTGVEFTLAADAWSRGGPLVVILFSAIAAFCLTAGEALAHRASGHHAGVASILTLPIAKAAFFDASIFPLLTTLRTIVLFTAATAAVVVVVELARRPLGLRRLRTRTIPQHSTRAL